VAGSIPRRDQFSRSRVYALEADLLRGDFGAFELFELTTATIRDQQWSVIVGRFPLPLMVLLTYRGACFSPTIRWQQQTEGLAHPLDPIESNLTFPDGYPRLVYKCR
jgi:hypothetical protein